LILGEIPAAGIAINAKLISVFWRWFGPGGWPSRLARYPYSCPWTPFAGEPSR